MCPYYLIGVLRNLKVRDRPKEEIPFADLFDALHDLKGVLDVPRKDFVEHRPQKEEPGH